MDNTATAAIRWLDFPLAAVRALWAGQTWRSFAHLVTGSFIGGAGGIAIFILLVTAAAGLVTIGITLAAFGALLVVSGALTAVQRSRHTAFLGVQWPERAHETSVSFTPRSLMAYVRNSVTWRRLSYHLIASGYGPIAAYLTIWAWTVGAALLLAPLYWTEAHPVWFRHPALVCVAGLALLLAAPWVTRVLAATDAFLARQLLGTTRSEELELRVADLAASRDSTVDAADAERRRIERDLHDGAQQRLTSLAMNLGIARATLTDLPESGARAIEQAHQESIQVLGELRDLVRGLHPAVLEDRGLDAALSAVAARSPVPVRLHVEMDRRVARDVEAVAYFVVSEALTNVARHATAAHAAVAISLTGDLLNVRVTDDGTGGADPDRGTGLRGLADRVRSVDGTFHLTSPAGGPTTIEAELPCAS